MKDSSFAVVECFNANYSANWIRDRRAESAKNYLVGFNANYSANWIRESWGEAQMMAATVSMLITVQIG